MSTARNRLIELIEELVASQRDQRVKAAAPKTVPPWDRLNSPLFLWFLSSIILGLISWGYTQYDEQQKKASETRSLLRKVDSEIAVRLDVLVNRVIQNKTPEADAVRNDIINGWKGEETGLHPEYRGVSLEALAALVAFTVAPSERPAVLEAREALAKLHVLARSDMPQNPEGQKGFIASARDLISSSVLPRWKITTISAK